MLAVTDLTSYMYCSRKLYYRKKLGIKEPRKEVSLKGTIKHEVYELVGKFDREIATSFSPKDTLEDIEMQFRRVYYKVLMKAIQKRKKILKDINVHPLGLYKELWPFFFSEAKARSSYFFDFAKSKNLYGESLWLSLPKSVSEVFVSSDKLGIRGYVDKVDIDAGFIPIEIKTGRAPSEGVWESHKIQVAAYMLLLSEHYGKSITKGIVDYRSINEKREIILNPFLESEVVDLIDKVNVLLEQDKLPERVKDINKCEVCGIKDECFKEN
jgi:CRISPR-associated protein Cas4